MKRERILRSLWLTADTGSVLWDFRVHAIRPRRDSASEVVDLGESGLLQKRDGLGTAAAHLAVDDDFAAGVEFVHALRQIVERDQVSADIANLIFVRLADIEDEQIVLRVQAPLQFFDLNLGNSARHRFLLPTNAAKLVVVYQLRDGRMRSARGAVRILAQLELAELHSEGIDQQQAADQRLTRAKDEFDHFRGLHHPDETRKNAQDAAFGA